MIPDAACLAPTELRGTAAVFWLFQVHRDLSLAQAHADLVLV
jgi:hypothetical protein